MTRCKLRTFATALTLLLAASVSALAQEPSKPADKSEKKPAAGCTPWAQKKFVHPPLKCMEPYLRIDDYPIVAWCFRGTRRTPTGRFVVGEDYASDAKALGFNVLIDEDGMREPCLKVGGMKMICVPFAVRPDKMEQRFFQGEHADHPTLIGVIQADDVHEIPRMVQETSEWLRKNYPHVMPMVSKYPTRSPQANTAIRVLMTMNYPFLRWEQQGRAFNDDRTVKLVAAYCAECNAERNFCNRNDMSMWVIFGGGNRFSQIRFQMLTAMAYGAQGLVNFAYTPTRPTTPWYHPGNPLVPAFKKAQGYMSQVAGRHLWGTMCLDVFHSPDGGEHPGAPHPDQGKLVVNLSGKCLVGLLTPQARFQSKDAADKAVPEYFLLVDKRSGIETPQAREAFVMLNPASVPAVEFLGYDANDQLRRIVPGYKVRVKTEGGEGFLLRVAPDLERLLGGKEGLKLYGEINQSLANLQLKTDPLPPAEGQKPADAKLPALEEAKGVAAAALAKVVELEKILAAAVSAGTISKAQAEDTLKNLKEAIEASVDEVKNPRPKTLPPEPPPAPSQKKR